MSLLMDPSSRRQRVQTLFEAVLDTPPHARGSLLSQLSGADAPLRGDVEQLLVEYERGGSFLEQTPPDLLSTAVWADDRTRTVLPVIQRGPLDEARFAAGQIFAARFRIVSFLGRGGMGEVYRAEDLSLQQPVALKLLIPPSIY
jgi:hypothetical protein